MPPLRTSLHIVVAVAALLLQACATPISPEAVASADYGPPPSERHQEIIRERFAKILIDPTAPLYEFDAPRKGYTRNSPMFGTREAFGWRVCGTVNSKNRFGGYTGRAPFFVLFRGDTIVEFVYGEAGQNAMISNTAIQQACDR